MNIKSPFLPFPVMTSLHDIANHGPCHSGWDTLLAAHGGKKADYHELFPLSFIIGSNGLSDAVWAMRSRPEYSSLWRKVAIKMVEMQRGASESTRAKTMEYLTIAWRHSEGLICDEELLKIHDELYKSILPESLPITRTKYDRKMLSTMAFAMSLDISNRIWLILSWSKIGDGELLYEQMIDLVLRAMSTGEVEPLNAQQTDTMQGCDSN